MRPLLLGFFASVAILLPSSRFLAAQELRKPTTYKLRESNAYRALDLPTRKRLERVVADLAVLEKALNAFMDDHNDAPPKSLRDLVPKYLKCLPVDPFAKSDIEIPQTLKHFKRSLDGRGYIYCQKANGYLIKSYEPLEFQPLPGAWDIRSVGLPTFPLRHPVSNPGLIRTHGYWGRRQLDVF